MSQTDHKIVITHATELKPGAKYLIALDSNHTTKEDAHLLLDGIRAMGVENAVCLMTDGDPTKTVQIIEQSE